jgi:hypothetical protein
VIEIFRARQKVPPSVSVATPGAHHFTASGDVNSTRILGASAHFRGAEHMDMC